MQYDALMFLFLTTAIVFGSNVHSCPSPLSIKSCTCSSSLSENGQNSRWVNVSCSYSRSWTQIRDALHPFRKSDQYFIQTLYIEKVRDRLSNGTQLKGLFRHLRLAELVITDSVLTVEGRVPKSIFTNASAITALHLHDVGLTTVPTRALSQLPILNELSLARNSIPSIASRAFRHQANTLRYLDLQRNRLIQVPGEAIKDLTHLEVLLLNGNNIRQILADQFNSIPNLEALELSDNELTFIDDRAFGGLYRLKHLGLAGNPLSAGVYKAFRHVPCPHGLLSLDVSETAIDLREKQWPENTHENLTSLVAQNQFRTINYESLSLYSKLTDLDLKGNWQLDPEEFRHPRTLDSIRRLDATETNLSLDQLRAFPNLDTLYMNSNRVRHLKQIHLTPLNSLRSLHLSNCHMRFVEMSSFWHLRWSIREINLSHNRLKRLRRRIFHNLTTLISVDLSYNHFRDYGIRGGKVNQRGPIFPLDKRFFDRHSSRTMQILSLAGNGLRRVPEKCLMSLRQLKNLDLSGNRIENVQMQFKGNVGLEHLNLRSNKIAYIHPDAFRSLTKLRSLNLSWNQLTTVSAVFFPIRLEELDLARCYLNDLRNPFLASMHRLRSVDLSYNMLETIFDRLFQNAAATLIYVDLAMNPLNCGCGLQPFVEWLSANKVTLSADTRCFWPIELRYMRPLVASVCWSNCANNGTESGNETGQLTNGCTKSFDYVEGTTVGSVTP